MTTATLALTGIALAIFHGGLTMALAVVFASSVLTFIALHYMGWHAQRAVFGGEIVVALVALYIGSEWLWHRLAGH